MNTPNSVQVIPTGKWRENCYLLWNRDRELLIFDPGSDASDIVTFIDGNQLRPLAILNTHGHYDHVGAVKALQEKYAISFYLHERDFKLLKQANFYRGIFDGDLPVEIPVVDFPITDETLHIEIGGFEIEVIVTPGHTGGGVCFKIGNDMMTGDTLLRGKIGRADLPGGNSHQLLNSLRRICQYDGQTTIYPGHGVKSSIAEELKSNMELIEAIQ
jgi:glyoxylase-like metal-dependent hydrolase (beta-lactamase superfamily II)